MRLLGAAIVLACLVSSGTGPVRAQPYDGPPTGGTRYWEVPAFRDYPHIGPANATGIIFWSHGLAGTMAQYQYAPPPIILEFAKRNWDVAKVQRNPAYEDGWGHAGQMHVDDIVERTRKARGSGYKRVIAAGQSYGGAISLEAAGRTDQIFGVLAFAPGHGSDACISGGQSERRIADTLAGLLIPAIDRVKAPRVVVSMAEEDECLGGTRPGAQIEQSLRRTQAKYIHFDAKMPIRGHGAAALNQFSFWYRDCLIAFMAPDKEPAAGRTDCPPPPNPRFMVAATVKLDARPGKLDAPADFAGPWLARLNGGSSATTGQEVCFVLDKVSADEASGTAYFGPGGQLKLNMSTLRVVARKNGDSYVHQSSENFQIVLTPRPAKAEIAMTMIAPNGTSRWSATMQRGCAG